MASSEERMINLPGVITALLGVMIAIECFAATAPRGLVYSFFEALAFIPLRFSLLLAPQSVLAALNQGAALDLSGQEQLAATLNAGPAVYFTPLTYAFLHGGWTHLTINGLTFAAFGAPVARRLGAALFLLFFACCAVAGAMTHLALHPLDVAPVVGASAAISGTMAAVVRFAFSPGARLGEDGRGRKARTTSLRRLGENRQAVIFLVVWFAANALLGAFPAASGSSEAIAWEAHMGGFLFGLVTFGAFDYQARRWGAESERAG
ncbi:MAG TPA: rhomboid family intramembrane serine protease [Methylocystis sp.]